MIIIYPNSYPSQLESQIDILHSVPEVAVTEHFRPHPVVPQKPRPKQVTNRYLTSSAIYIVFGRVCLQAPLSLRFVRSQLVHKVVVEECVVPRNHLALHLRDRRSKVLVVL